MTRIIDTKSKRRLSAKLAAGLAISAFLLLGTSVAPASAGGSQSDHHWNNNNNYNNNYNRGYGWGGSYYVASPVIYGTPYYAPQYYSPPPVVYAPGIGISLPGISIGVQ